MTEGRSAEALKPPQDFQQVQCESYGWELDQDFSQGLAGKQARPQRLDKSNLVDVDYDGISPEKLTPSQSHHTPE